MRKSTRAGWTCGSGRGWTRCFCAPLLHWVFGGSNSLVLILILILIGFIRRRRRRRYWHRTGRGGRDRGATSGRCRGGGRPGPAPSTGSSGASACGAGAGAAGAWTDRRALPGCDWPTIGPQSVHRLLQGLRGLHTDERSRREQERLEPGTMSPTAGRRPPANAWRKLCSFNSRSMRCEIRPECAMATPTWVRRGNAANSSKICA